MSGLDVPSSGTAAFEGRAHLGAAEWTRLRARRIGLIFHDFNLLPTLTASENVEVAMFGQVWSAAERRRRAHERLAEVGVAHCAGRLPQQLSGGERRRVGVARSLANGPELLLADEPTANLDTATGATVADLLLDVHRSRGMTLVIVTHDMALIERCGRQVRLLDGRVAADQTAPGEIAA
jgi:putative ABC transport system ATP-binding protein